MGSVVNSPAGQRLDRKRISRILSITEYFYSAGRIKYFHIDHYSDAKGTITAVAEHYTWLEINANLRRKHLLQLLISTDIMQIQQYGRAGSNKVDHDDV